MRIRSLSLANFRAITNVALESVADTVVIAGPNGCGKSCVFDAIRLVKSAYGGYQPNEWQNWFGEFQINFNQRGTNWLSLFQDRSKPLKLTVDFELSNEEIGYLNRAGNAVLEAQVWRRLVPELASWRSLGMTPIATNLRVHEPEVKARTATELPHLLEALQRPSHRGRVTVSPAGIVETEPSPLLELVFSQYDPANVGIIDYHGANRNYGREQVGGINLNIDSSEDRLRQHALYNYANKYANLKSEMAASYVRHLIAKEADSSIPADRDLSETLKELFATFFPGKEFLGPRPTADGRMLFPVRTTTGAEHDIDDLSAGEKEVLYGYLRLRNAAPRNSVLLIDEPELHLNPRLIAGLASFYHRHLGQALGNQLWLVTHSDTLIREAVGQTGFSVFHLQPPGQYEGTNQVTAVGSGAAVERLVIDLVGDLAAYRPGAKIVIFEGGGESQFDVSMSGALFPEFQARVNSLSAGNRKRVDDLYELLESARSKGQIPGRFYAITDADSDPAPQRAIPRRFRWDRYHIENYLLEPRFVLQSLQDLLGAKCKLDSEADVDSALIDAARSTIPLLVAHQLRNLTNRALVERIDLSFDPSCTEVARGLADAVDRSKKRLEAVFAGQVNYGELKAREQEITAQANGQLSDGSWRTRFRGRDVLKRFTALHAQPVQYDVLRNSIVARMRDAAFQPKGMLDVVRAILSD